MTKYRVIYTPDEDDYGDLFKYNEKLEYCERVYELEADTPFEAAEYIFREVIPKWPDQKDYPYEPPGHANDYDMDYDPYKGYKISSKAWEFRYAPAHGGLMLRTHVMEVDNEKD